MFKPQDSITIARAILNDTDSSNYRQTDTELLGYFNDGLKEANSLAEQFFISSGDFACTANKTEQAISFSEAKKLLDVIRIKDGKFVPVMDINMMAAFNPNWSSDVAAPAQNWFKMPSDPLRFYIYPKAPEMQVLEVLFVRNASVYALTDNINEVPDSMKPALADYIVYRSDSKDDEHANSGRAVSHWQAFTSKLGIVPQQA